jgi:hypothetical protein
MRGGEVGGRKIRSTDIDKDIAAGKDGVEREGGRNEGEEDKEGGVVVQQQ